MLRATLSSLLSRKRRLAFSAIAIVLSVLFVTGALVFMDTVGESQRATYARMYRDVDVVVEASVVPPGPDGADPIGTVPASLLDQVAGQPGVRAVTGVVTSPGVRVLGPNGKILDSLSTTVLGTNWRSGDSFLQLRSGRPPAAADEVAVNAALAKAAGLSPGDTVTLLRADLVRQSFRVVGSYGYAGGRDSAAGAREAAFQTPVVRQLLLGGADQYTALHVAAAPGVAVTGLRDLIARVSGPGYQVSTGGEHAAALVARNKAKGQDLFRRILLGFSGIAITVGVLMIINTFLILVAQRTRELALLRALGASRRQIVGSVVTEAAVVGVVGTSLGIALGTGLGALLVVAMNQAAGLDLGTPRVAPEAIAIAFLVGVPVTVLASLPPAVRASRVPPVAAMRPVAPEPGRPRRPRAGSGWRSRAGKLPNWGSAGTLGWRNARRSPRRTLLTAAALMIGMTVTAGASVVVASANTSLRQQAARELDLSLMVQAGGGNAGVSPETLDRLAQLAGVEAVTGSRFETVRIAIPGRSTPIDDEVNAVTDLAATVRMFSLAGESGQLGTTRADSVLVKAATARKYHLAVGSKVVMGFSRARSVTVTITGVYRESGFLPDWIAGPELAAYFTDQRATQVAMLVSPASATPGIRQTVEDMFAADPMITVSSLGEILDAAGAKFDQVLLAVQGLLALAILIAVLGVVNTLMLSIIERTRELGVLRAIGLGRSQTLRMITVESVVISAAGGVGGLVLGLALGVAGTSALASQGVTRIAVPWFYLVCYFLLTVVIGVSAALPPAWRSARTNVLAAIANPE